MNSNFSTQPRLRHAVVIQEHPDPLPHLPHQANNLCTVILLSSGAAVFAAGRRQYAVQPGDALVCRPGVRCTLLPGAEGIRYTTLAFTVQTTADTGYFPQENVFRCARHLPELLSLTGMLLAVGGQPAVQSHLLSALLLQISAGDTLPPEQTILTESPAYVMARYMDEHYAEDIFLSDIAGSAHITSSHAVHVFKPVYGVSPVQYLNSRRIGQAQHFLLATDLSASQIASQVGISNVNYFYTVFKKLVGRSPASYRAYLQDKVTRYMD